MRFLPTQRQETRRQVLPMAYVARPPKWTILAETMEKGAGQLYDKTTGSRASQGHPKVKVTFIQNQDFVLFQ